jgi:two-component system cell cycle sensor histidine kinase/response regulator CckA
MMSDHTLNQALRTLFEQGRDPMFITDERGLLTHVNPAFLDLYGYQEAEVIGRDTGFLQQSSFQNVVFFKRILRQLIKHGNWSGELNAVSESGEIIPVWTQVIKTEDGFSAIQVDLRERDKITRKMEGLSRLQSVATLAGGVAHEFNNILGGIQGHLYLFKRNLPEQLEKEHARLERVDKLMQRAASLVQNLLSFARQKSTATREIRLASLLENTVEMARKSLDKQVEIKLTVQDRGLVAFADAVVLKQHIFEMLSNAERALVQQREKLQYAYGEKDELIHIHLAQTKDKKYAEILIRDNGMGMQDATLRHCLDPFFSTEPVGEGTGLGLSSAAAYMQQLKGMLEVESVYGEYTAVHLRLPLAVDAIEESNKQGLILLVDDDEDLRESLGEILTCQGYEVMLADNGIAALDLWRQYERAIDAVVMDIIMPNMDGIEVAREIRAGNQKVPICLTTGYSYQRVPSSLHVNLMRKPLNPDLLISYLESNTGND